MALTWKTVAGSEPEVQKGYVQADDTNEAFTLVEHDTDNYQLESHITGHEMSEIFDTDTTAEADAKAFAEGQIALFNIPTEGTTITA